MTWPDLRVQIAFDSDPLDSGRTWTDVTDKVRAVETEVGRQRELDEYDPGTATVTLDNSSRLFDPLHTSGAYYGKLLPGKPIRVGVGYPYLIARDAPVSYYRFDEGSSLYCYDETGLADMILRATGTWTDTGLLNAGTNRALICDGTAYNGAYVTTNTAEHSVDTTGELTVEAWVNLDSVAANQAIVARQSTAGGDEWILWCTSAGYLRATLYNTTSGNYAVTGNTAGLALSAGVTHHVAFTWDGTTLRVYRDGVEGGTDSAFSGTLQGNVADTLTCVGHRDTGSSLPLAGTVDEVAIYDRALTAAEVLAHYTEGDSGAYEESLFTGFVDGWPQDYGDDDATDLEVRCTDAFGQLARYDLQRSVYAVEVLADSPRSWWRCRETHGNSIADSSGNNRTGQTTPFGELSGPERRAVPIVGEDSSMPVQYSQVNGGVSWWIYNPDENAGISAAFSLEFWLFYDAPNSAYTDWYFLVASTFLAGSDFYVYIGDSSGTTNQNRLTVEWGLAPGSGTLRRTTTDITPGLTHHVVITYASGVFKFYIDGQVVSGTGTHPAPPPTWDLAFNQSANNWSAAGDPNSVGTAVGEIACYESELTAARIAAHYTAATAPWDGDTSGTRVGRILDELSWPAKWESIAAGQVELGPSNIAGHNALEYLQSVASSEQGQLYVDPNTGKVTFRDRHHRLTATRSTVSQRTLSDDGAGIIYERATVRYDERQIVNECNVEWQGGVATHTDTVSVTAHGLASKTIKTELATYTEALNLAQWVVGRYKDPTVRVADIELAPSAVASAFPAAVNARIDDRITFEKTPQGAGSQIAKDVIVEGVKHTIDNGLGTWRTTLYTSEADAGPWFVWGTATWDETTRWTW